MKLKQLEMALQDVDVFENPKVMYVTHSVSFYIWSTAQIHLEQYPTTPHLAACVLHEAHSRFGDIEGLSVADLGYESALSFIS